MIYLGLAAICAVIGIIPLLAGKKITAATVQGAISLFVVWGILYLAAPSTVYPFFGPVGIFILILWIIAAIIDGVLKNNITKVILFPILAVILYLSSAIFGSGMFRANDYAKMIGVVEKKVWTQEVQPKDPRHMRMSTRENAVYLAKKILGEAGAIGSQFYISEEYMTLQMINKELWYVVPLDYAGFSVWTSTDGVPGYIMIHGEDPYRQAILKILPENQKMQYTPAAYFGDNLKRHLRINGCLNKGLTDYTFEIDENQKAWWVITTFEPTIIWSGKKVTGITVVDPVNGNATFYPLDKVPDWVDRAIPSSYVKQYFEWHGEYTHGWVNSWWGQKDLTKPEEPNLIYGSDGQPEWVTGITSKSDKDDSLIALVYTNSRTGKSILYKVSGGGTDAAVLDAVDKNNHVQFKKLHGADPQLYNVYGTMASVVPLLNESHAFQGVAIVAINNIQTVAVGDDQYGALREYEKLLARGGQQVTLDKERNLQIVDGIVDRFNQEIQTTGTVYYIHLPGIPHLFVGGAGELSVKLPVTKIGDKVKIEYYASDRDVVPMHGFDNLSLPLNVTKSQVSIREKGIERKTGEENKQDAKTVMENIKNLTPEEIKELGKQIKKK